MLLSLLPLDVEDLPLGGAPSPLRWMDILEMGISSIDADHRSFIEQYEMLRLTLAQLGRESLQAGLRRLLDHCTMHFEREEALLRLSGFPRYVSHLRAHRQFLLRFEELCGRAAHAEETQAAFRAIVGSLRGVLIDLLFRHDLDYKSHVLHSMGR